MAVSGNINESNNQDYDSSVADNISSYSTCLCAGKSRGGGGGGGATSGVSVKKKFTLKQLSKHIKKTMSFKSERKKVYKKTNNRNRSNSDAGIYNFWESKKIGDSQFSLTEICRTDSTSDIPAVFARQMLTLSCPAVVTIRVRPPTESRSPSPRARINEDDSSSHSSAAHPGSDIDTVKYQRHVSPDPALLHGSTGTFNSGTVSGSAGNSARSAPSTPVGQLQQPPPSSQTSSVTNIDTTNSISNNFTTSSNISCSSTSNVSSSNVNNSSNNLTAGGTTAANGSTATGTTGNGSNEYVPSSPCSPASCPNHYHPPSSSTGQLNRSPSHVFNKTDKDSAKLSSNSSMTGQIRTPEPPSPKKPKQKKVKKKQVAIPSKSRQKKFHRHFPHVDANEMVLNYYSCALIADILLQGHLYITKNYFAFYSNVFGYVTKLLIPTSSVLKISKERTGKIFPNAVGITTEDDKHVFGSLLSRESTYNFLLRVWNSAVSPEPETVILPAIVAKEIPSELDVSEASIEDDDDSSSHTDNEITITAAVDEKISSVLRKRVIPPLPSVGKDEQIDPTKERGKFPPAKLLQQSGESNNLLKSDQSLTRCSSMEKLRHRIKTLYIKFYQLPRLNQIMILSTFLLVLLFLSAGVLLYKIGTLHQRHFTGYQSQIEALSKGDNIYNEILKWQVQLRSKSSQEINTFLHSNLEQIAKIRQSLEALSLLIAPSKDDETAKQETGKQPLSSSTEQKTKS